MTSDSSIDESEYFAANPDVAVAVSKGEFLSGQDHYDKYGKQEGRMLRPSITGESQRERAVFYLLDKKGQGLEVGPSHNPIAPKKKGFNVHILDHASAGELRNKYQGHNVCLENIEEVDFVWHGENLIELIGKTDYYDWIIASHVIEHVPDFVSFLQQCDALLKPTGILSLVIPDKRYCFDFFSYSTSTGSILDAYAERRSRPSPGQIFDHFANAAKRNGNIAWALDEMGGADSLVHTFDEAAALWLISSTKTEYIDVHCWRFTPASFRLLIADLSRLKLINLEIRAEFETVGCEFYISLGKIQSPVTEIDRFNFLKNRKLENA